MQKLSFIIPCYKSEGMIDAVIKEIENTVEILGSYDYEILCINDCSPDNVLDVLKDLARNKPYLKVIDFAKNQGKHAALMAGYAHASGDIIVCLDDDGQCPMDQLKSLLEPLNHGYDVAIAKYPQKEQSLFKNFGSKVNAAMAHILIDKPKDLQLANFFAMKRFVSDELIRYKSAYPYVDGLVLRTTQNICNVPMVERARISGTTGYTFLKSLRLFLNGFTSFSVKPLRFASIAGMCCTAIGGIYGIYIVFHKLLNPQIPAGYSSLMAIQLFVGGIIMLMLGMIGEYIGRIYICINNAPQYVIRETVNLDKHKEVDR